MYSKTPHSFRLLYTIILLDTFNAINKQLIRHNMLKNCLNIFKRVELKHIFYHEFPPCYFLHLPYMYTFKQNKKKEEENNGNPTKIFPLKKNLKQGKRVGFNI